MLGPTVFSLRRGTCGEQKRVRQQSRQRQTRPSPAAKLRDLAWWMRNAVQDGTYPLVWDNDSVNGSFGITSRISRIRLLQMLARKHTGGPEQRSPLEYGLRTKTHSTLSMTVMATTLSMARHRSTLWPLPKQRRVCRCGHLIPTAAPGNSLTHCRKV